jgi:hypothetical protein
MLSRDVSCQFPGGITVVNKSGRGIFLVDPKGESADNERLLAGLRKRGLDEAVWSFTHNVFATCAAQGSIYKDEF